MQCSSEMTWPRSASSRKLLGLFWRSFELSFCLLNWIGRRPQQRFAFIQREAWARLRLGLDCPERAVCGSFDCLINASTGTVIGDFSLNGSHFTGLFGLAYDGTTMWATGGTSIYSVNLINGNVAFDVSFAGYGLSDANGTTIAVSTTPIPGALPLFAGGLSFVGYLTRRRKRRGQPSACWSLTERSFSRARSSAVFKT